MHCDNCYCTQVDDWVDVPVRPVVDAVDTFARDAVALVHIDLKFVQKFLEMLAFYIHSWDSDETLCMNDKENQFGHITGANFIVFSLSNKRCHYDLVLNLDDVIKSRG